MSPSALPAFFRAVGLGGLAGALPHSFLMIPIGLSLIWEGGVLDGAYVMFMPLLFGLPIVFAACVILGLPLTVLLARSGRETGKIYVAAGFLAGSLPFLLLLPTMGPVGAGVLACSGGLGGAVAGWVWGRHRDELAAIQTSD